MDASGANLFFCCCIEPFGGCVLYQLSMIPQNDHYI
jgi:hypothetical protein